MRAVTVLILLLQAQVSALSDDSPVVSLDGIRQVEVTIGGDRATFEVSVRMKPIECFDKGTNDRLNAQKARSYGLQGLLKHLNGDQNSRAIVSGITVIETRYDRESYRLTLRIPRDGFEIIHRPVVHFEPRKTSSVSPTEEIKLTSSLLTCFGDHSATIEQLVSVFDQELDSVISVPGKAGNNFEIAIVELEERLAAWLDQFEQNVATDRLLLVVERTDLISKIDSTRKRCIQELKFAVKQNEQQRLKEDRLIQFSDVEIEAEFEIYLKSDQLLMEVAGCKIIRQNDGSTVVVAVGSTALKDKGAAEMLRAEKVCRLKAISSLVAEKQGVQIAHVEELKDSTVVVIENGAEKSSSVMELLKITKGKVDGMTRDMPVIGRWRSADGDVYFLAIGAILDKSGNPVSSTTQ